MEIAIDRRLIMHGQLLWQQMLTLPDAWAFCAMRSICAVQRHSRGVAATRRLVGMFFGSLSCLLPAAAAAAAFVANPKAARTSTGIAMMHTVQR